MKSRKLTVTLFILYLLILSWVILLKTGFSFAFLDTGRSINLIPFGAMNIRNGAPNYGEVIYNALLFVPFGIFMCMLKRKNSFASLIMPVVLTSLSFEVIQYIFAIGASDITDFIANTSGGIAGIGVFFIFHKLCKENVYTVMNIIALVLVIGLALFYGMVMFFNR
ncbi:MAG TPA: VanZ family protein [Feifaniaceae bacterium]|nr:VanZ family protein [Feifaniaceae bacterium]